MFSDFVIITAQDSSQPLNSLVVDAHEYVGSLGNSPTTPANGAGGEGVGWK